MSDSGKTWDVIVVGGGPAGFIASVCAARRGLSVLLLEKNRDPLRKLKISGKGRCNLTNNCTDSEFFDNVLRGGKFLRSAEARFGPQEIMAFFEQLGVPLKTERGRRVFPVSDRAADVADALVRAARSAGVTMLQKDVAGILTEDGAVTGVRTSDGTYASRSVILATGGLSYPSTGSDGDGMRFARDLGHSVTECCPALVPLVCEEGWIPEVEGLSLRNVALTAKKGKKTIFSEQGEMLFTSDGISGPLALSLSSYLAGEDLTQIRCRIDLKPALDAETLDRRILRDFSEGKNRTFRNSLDGLLPASLIPVVVRLSGIDPEKRLNQVSAQERRRLADILKNLTVTVCGTRGFREAIVTAGGVSTKEIDPGTMASRKIGNLHFAGEIIDVDGLTGGYNLTIAFATGYAAGISILGEEK